VLAQLAVATGTNTITGGLGPLPPGQPQNVRVTARDKAATVAWESPSSLGPRPITGYRIERRSAGGSWLVERTTGPNIRSAVVRGLVNGRRYQFRITATTDTGLGLPSDAVAVVPRTVPGPPRKVRAQPGNRRVTVAWTPPAATGGSAITRYRVQMLRPGGTWATVATRAASARRVVVPGLNRRATYRFRVVAINTAGAGAPSAVVRARPRLP
jgi:hypothetical protein